MSCILYNICLVFDHLQWSHIIYCNGSTTFHYIVWCEAADKIIDVANSHDSRLIYIIPQIHNKINFSSPSVCNLLQSKYT